MNAPEPPARRTSGAALATALLITLGLMIQPPAASAQDSPGFVTALAAQRAGLLSLLSTNADLQGQQALRRFLGGGPPGETPPASLIHAVFDAGLHPRGAAATTGFIEAEPVLEVLVGALADDDAAIRNQAFSYLVDYAPPDRLAPYQSRVLGALDRHSWKDGARLKALLPLDPAMRVQLLNQPGLAPEIAARLGDTAAETGLIERWNKAGDYQELAALAGRLGYVGSPSAARALLGRFDSPVHLDAPVELRSIRADLIAALGRIHPREPLLTSNLQARLLAGDGDGATVQAYLRQVAEWGRREYAIEVQLPARPPWLAEKIIAKRFPRKAAQP